MKRSKWIPAVVLLLVPVMAQYWDNRPGVAHASQPATRSPAPVAAAPEPADTSPAWREAPTSVPSAAPVLDEPATDPAPTPPGSVPSPVPLGPVEPDPVSTWDLAPALEAGVKEAMAGFPGRFSVIVHDLASGERWTLGAHDRYHPASTIKMPVTLYALEQHRTGALNWQYGIVYTEADFESPGGGAFETAPFGDAYPVENLVGRALRYSNNVAVNMLGRHLGWENIRAWTRSIDGELYRLPDATPQVSPLSLLGWWLHLDRISREDPTKAELVLQPLREVAYQGRITAGLPSDVPHLHKFGSYDGNYHDSAVVWAHRPYILVVMTAEAMEHEADAAIARVSAQVYQVLNP